MVMCSIPGMVDAGLAAQAETSFFCSVKQVGL